MRSRATTTTVLARLALGLAACGEKQEPALAKIAPPPRDLPLGAAVAQLADGGIESRGVRRKN